LKEERAERKQSETWVRNTEMGADFGREEKRAKVAGGGEGQSCIERSVKITWSQCGGANGVVAEAATGNELEASL